MQLFIMAALITLLATPSFAEDTLKSEEQKTLYTVGMIIARQLSSFTLTPAEFEVVKQGMADAVTGATPKVELEAYKDKTYELLRARRKALGDKMAPANQDFLNKATAEKGSLKTASGLIYTLLKEGTGASPNPEDSVKINFRGTLSDGKEFDSTDKRGKAAEFRLDAAIKCWNEGLHMMKTGGKAKLVCPAQLAYGENGMGRDIPPGAPLVFEIELLEVKQLAKTEH